MQNLKLNKTPIRTSQNFNINNIKLQNVIIPEKIQNFENVIITGQNPKITIDNKCSNIQLQHGLHDELEKQVAQDANQKIHLKIDGKVEQELQINFNFDKNNLQLVENMEITANEDSKATVIVKYEAKKGLECYHNGILRVNAKKGANVKIVFVNLLNTVSHHFMAMENTLEENAKVAYCMIDFGGKNSVTNWYSNLLGKTCENTIHTVYLGKENQLFDLNYISEIKGERSKVEMEVQGALKETAKKHFKGTIDFKKGCKKAIGNENEACLLLSDTAKSLGLPMLLCSEEEVQGNHSSSAGKVGQKELFYLMSRGFDEKQAMKLMVRAKFHEVLERIENEGLRNYILKEMDERLE